MKLYSQQCSCGQEKLVLKQRLEKCHMASNLIVLHNQNDVNLRDPPHKAKIQDLSNLFGF